MSLFSACFQFRVYMLDINAVKGFHHPSETFPFIEINDLEHPHIRHHFGKRDGSDPTLSDLTRVTQYVKSVVILSRPFTQKGSVLQGFWDYSRRLLECSQKLLLRTPLQLPS